MPNNNNSTMELSGSIKLTELKFVSVAGQPGNMWLQIPIEANPALFMTTDKKTGKPVVSLDISIWRNASPKYDNTHYVRASVGKKNGEGLTEEQRREANVILGNLKTFTPRNTAAPQGAPAAPGTPGAPMPPQPGYQGSGYPAQGPYAPQQPQQPAFPTQGQQYPGQYPPAPQGFAMPPQPGNYDPNDLP